MIHETKQYCKFQRREIGSLHEQPPADLLRDRRDAVLKKKNIRH